MEVILVSICAPLLVIGVAAVVKLVWDMRAELAASEIKWERNQSDHDRAFKEIASLRAGQEGIKSKVDNLTMEVKRNASKK